jgi:hypothetical protein
MTVGAVYIAFMVCFDRGHEGNVVFSQLLIHEYRHIKLACVSAEICLQRQIYGHVDRWLYK